jgi:Uri superfamily endonuclease
MKFSEWLIQRDQKNETATSTADVAGFARPLGSTDDEKKKSHLFRTRKYPKINEFEKK